MSTLIIHITSNIIVLVCASLICLSSMRIQKYNLITFTREQDICILLMIISKHINQILNVRKIGKDWCGNDSVIY